MGEGSPGRSEGSGEKKERAEDFFLKKESKSLERWGKKRRRNEEECCFDVKGDGWAVVRDEREK